MRGRENKREENEKVRGLRDIEKTKRVREENSFFNQRRRDV